MKKSRKIDLFQTILIFNSEHIDECGVSGITFRYGKREK